MKENLERLAPAWIALATRWGAAPERAVALYDDIALSYGEPGRYYHTIEHIADLLDTLERAGPGDDPEALIFAAWYHDIVYDTHAADNEERSADRARDALRLLSLPAGMIERVVRLVLATKDHRVEPGDDDGALFLDADLAILGSRDRYGDYARGIGLEYAWVPPAPYRAGRIRVLESFLHRERIYLTRKMYERFEARARLNIAGELSDLQAARLS